jgi:hypothetical protein
VFAAILLVVALAAVVATAAQIAIPRIAVARVRDGLTRGGGSAEVTVAAVPATRLLRGRGDRLVVRGRELAIGLAGAAGEEAERAGLKALDGFDVVDVELQDLQAGPFAVGALVLARGRGESYAFAMRGTVAAADLVRLADEMLSGLPTGPVAGAVAGGLSLTGREISVSVQIELISEPAGLRVGAGGGTVAGYPAGPIATAVAAAVARRLQLAPT